MLHIQALSISISALNSRILTQNTNPQQYLVYKEAHTLPRRRIGPDLINTAAVTAIWAQHQTPLEKDSLLGQTFG